MDDVAALCVLGDGRIKLGDQARNSPVCNAACHQIADGLGQPNDERDQGEQWQDPAHDKNRLPAKRADQGSADHAAYRRAQWKAAKHDADQDRTHALWGVLACQRNDVGHGAPKAKTCQEAVYEQLVQGGRSGGDESKDAKKQHGEQDHALATETICSRT